MLVVGDKGGGGIQLFKPKISKQLKIKNLLLLLIRKKM
jgi:hypothetical protein